MPQHYGPLSDTDRRNCNKCLERLAEIQQDIERWKRTGADTTEHERRRELAVRRLEAFKREYFPNQP